jgi:hypothetical protein
MTLLAADALTVTARIGGETIPVIQNVDFPRALHYSSRIATAWGPVDALMHRGEAETQGSISTDVYSTFRHTAPDVTHRVA